MWLDLHSVLLQARIQNVGLWPEGLLVHVAMASSMYRQQRVSALTPSEATLEVQIYSSCFVLQNLGPSHTLMSLITGLSHESSTCK